MNNKFCFMKENVSISSQTLIVFSLLLNMFITIPLKALTFSPTQLMITATSTAITCKGLNNGTISLAVTGGVGPYTYSWSNGSYTTGMVTLNASKDNSIYQSHVNNSNGAGEYLVAGQTGFGFNTRALIAFSIAGNVPANAVITNASLKVNQSLSSGASGIQDMELHRLLQNWGEGTSFTGGQAGQGAPATLNDATWSNSFYPSTLWSIPGGVFSSTVSATTPVGSPDLYYWSDTEMANDIQYWLNNPSLNFGWVLKGLETAPLQAKRFDSRENSLPANRPELTINYTQNTVFSTSQNLSGLAPGIYIVTVTDANGSTATKSIVINEPNELQITITGQASSCNYANGNAIAIPLGGTSPYNFLWTNSQTTGMINNLSPGNYSVTVTDARGCKVYGSKTISNIGVPSQSTTTIDTCSNFLWNGNIYSTSGTYIYSTTNSVGCDSIATLNLIIKPCLVTLHLKLFLEGYYSNGTLAPQLYNSGTSNNPNDVDSLVVELRNSFQPFSVYKSGTTILNVNGEAEIIFTEMIFGSSYYITIKQKSSLETWSKNPVTMSAYVNFDFTNY